MRFSNRAAWDLQPNPLAIRLEQLRRARAPLLDLTETNPTRAGFAWDPAAVNAALTSGPNDCYEPEPQGLQSAREALAAALTPLGVDAAPERTFLTASTSEAYSFIFKLLCDPGANLLVPRPCYPLLEDLARLDGVELRPYSLELDAGWAVRFDDVAEVADRRTRGIVVVNPGNPTGTFLRRDEYARLMALCARHKWSVISDEVFAQYSWTTVPDVVRFAAASGAPALTFSLSGLSKLAALPQLKLGWMTLNGPTARVAEAVARLEVIADSYLSVGTPVQHAAASLVAQSGPIRERILNHVVAQRTRLIAARKVNSAWSVIPAEAGWSAVIRVPRHRPEEEIALRLLDAGILVHPGHFFDFPRGHYLVVSLLTHSDVFERALPTLVGVLEGL